MAGEMGWGKIETVTEREFREAEKVLARYYWAMDPSFNPMVPEDFLMTPSAVTWMEECRTRLHKEQLEHRRN